MCCRRPEREHNEEVALEEDGTEEAADRTAGRVGHLHNHIGHSPAEAGRTDLDPDPEAAGHTVPDPEAADRIDFDLGVGRIDLDLGVGHTVLDLGVGRTDFDPGEVDHTDLGLDPEEAVVHTGTDPVGRHEG